MLSALEEAEAAHVIQAEGGREAKWMFAHELIRQTLVSALSLPRRQRLHLLIAEAMERVYASALEKRAADLAHHLYQAGTAADPEKTVRYLTQAGDQALFASAFEEGLRNYEMALSLGDRMPQQERADLLVKRGQGLRSLGRGGEAITHWKEALSIYEGLGDVEAVARLYSDMAYQLTFLNRWPEAAQISMRGLEALGDQPTANRCRLLAAAGLTVGVNGDYETGSAMLNEAQGIAQQLADGHLLGQVLSNRVILCHAYSEYDQAVQAGGRAAAELRRAGNLWELAGVLGFLEVDLNNLGRLDESSACDDELRPVAVRLGHHGALMLADCGRAGRDPMRTANKIAQPEVRRWYAQMLIDRHAPGDCDRARTLLGEAIEMYRRIGMPKHLAIAEVLLRET